MEKQRPKNQEMCPGGQHKMEEKVLPSFGDTQDHPGSTSETLSLATWHRGPTGHVLEDGEKVSHRDGSAWLFLAFHTSACL